MYMDDVCHPVEGSCHTPSDFLDGILDELLSRISTYITDQ